ncbi:MAG: GEGP motif-containing diheme protein [bacterium]
MKKLGPASPVIAAIILVSTASALAYYAAHKDKDSPVVLGVYPQLAGTALDGCCLCHRGGEALAPGDSSGKAVKVGSCDFCHDLVRGKEKHARLTLNSYGLDYLEAGADAGALRAIEEKDSDGDGVSNGEEIESLTPPGDPSKKPGLPAAPLKILSLDELKKSGIPILEQTIFVNVSKSPEGDSYRTFRGFMLKDVVALAGAREDSASVDVISIDTYQKTFSFAQLGEAYPQAEPVFGFGKDDLGDCGWVRYDAPSLEPGKPLPDANILLTFETQGSEYGPAEYDSETGTLKGYGPFRLVAPQMVNPGPPDSSSRATPECAAKAPAEYKYHKDYEKNSDYCVKSVIAIRVNPLPPGTTDPDRRKDALEHLKSGRIVIYGNID